MAQSKKRKRKKKGPGKRVLALRAGVAARLVEDTFAHSKVKELALERGAFKGAPSRVGGDLSDVGARLKTEMNAFFAALATTPADVENVFRKEVGKTYRVIVDRTPVDTGMARSGWRLEVASDNPLVMRIVNAVPYSLYLEYGWSKQAPAGMLRVSILEFADRLRRATDAFYGAA